jgi:hypothetical protein
MLFFKNNHISLYQLPKLPNPNTPAVAKAMAGKQFPMK